MGSFICPLCQEEVAPENVLGATAFCRCGWHGPSNFYELKRITKIRKRIEKSILLLALLAAAFCFYDWTRFGHYFSNHVILTVKTRLGLATKDDWLELGTICNTVHRYGCSEQAFGKILKIQPDNRRALANFAIAQSQLGEHDAAIANFETLFSKGNGWADSMAAYAESLEAKGREKDAEKWYFRAVSIEPGLLEIDSRLIDMLVKRKAYTEALSLMGNIFAYIPSAKEYLQGRLLTISDLARHSATDLPEKTMRLASLSNHHFLPVRFGGEKAPTFFLVDTGATFLTMDTDFLQNQKIEYTPVRQVVLEAAGGQMMNGLVVIIKKLQVGTWELHDIEAAVCDDCKLLAGKSILRQFQMATNEADGIEYIVLKR